MQIRREFQNKIKQSCTDLKRLKNKSTKSKLPGEQFLSLLMLNLVYQVRDILQAKRYVPIIHDFVEVIVVFSPEE